MSTERAKGEHDLFRERQLTHADSRNRRRASFDRTGTCQAFLPYAEGVLVEKIDLEAATGKIARRYAPRSIPGRHMIDAATALAAPSRRKPPVRLRRSLATDAVEPGAPHRARRRPDAVCNRARLLGLPRPGRARVRSGLRGPVRHSRGRQHRRAFAGRQRRVCGLYVWHPARRRHGPHAVRRDPGDGR